MTVAGICQQHNANHSHLRPNFRQSHNFGRPTAQQSHRALFLFFFFFFLRWRRGDVWILDRPRSDGAKVSESLMEQTASQFARAGFRCQPQPRFRTTEGDTHASTPVLRRPPKRDLETTANERFCCGPRGPSNFRMHTVNRRPAVGVRTEEVPFTADGGDMIPDRYLLCARNIQPVRVVGHAPAADVCCPSSSNGGGLGLAGGLGLDNPDPCRLGRARQLYPNQSR